MTPAVRYEDAEHLRAEGEVRASLTPEDSGTGNWFDRASLEELEDAYESLADGRSVFGQALAELIEERRRQAKDSGTEGTND